MDLTGFAITAQGVPSFTITGETSTTVVPALSITRSNNLVQLRWPDPSLAYAVQMRTNLSDCAWNTLPPIHPVAVGFAGSTFDLAESAAPTVFFRLVRPTYDY